MDEESDIQENELLARDKTLLDLLLKDHTTQKNILWCTNLYSYKGEGYQSSDPITPEKITGENGSLIKPRTCKSADEQSQRVKDHAEVFTPAWVCNAQNNLIDTAWFGRPNVFNTESLTAEGEHTWTPTPAPITFPEGKTWKNYVRENRLEITCGEAPYLVSRYDATTGLPIALPRRIGLLDRKLRVVGENTTTSCEWLIGAHYAYKSIYAYEWQGDNLLLAREALFMTFIDYYQQKFGKEPTPKSQKWIAYIIGWNVWQMDGLKCVVPNSCHEVGSGDLYNEEATDPCPGCQEGGINHNHNGIYCVIKDWKKKKKERKIEFVRVLLDNKKK